MNILNIISAAIYRLGAGESEIKIPVLGERYDKDKAYLSSTSIGAYTVNLHKYTCTCPDFLKRRRYFEVGDVRRVCKHQAKELAQHEFYSDLDELTRAVIEYGANKKYLKRCLNKAGMEFALSSASSEWVDVVTRKKKKGEVEGDYTGEYDHFGYNTIEKRWSYGAAPAGATQIKSSINHVLGKSA